MAYSRRDFLVNLGRWAAALAVGGLGIRTAFAQEASTLWQIDPDRCTACGQCQDRCVLTPSAVKCVQAYSVCGYCDLCGGYFHGKARNLTTGAENLICPTAAIQRTFVEDPYFEYNILESRCVACGKCVIGCAAFGNASLYLQIRHDRCANCNECRIAASCPAGAISRVPRDQPYRLRGKKETSGGS